MRAIQFSPGSIEGELVQQGFDYLGSGRQATCLGDGELAVKVHQTAFQDEATAMAKATTLNDQYAFFKESPIGPFVTQTVTAVGEDETGFRVQQFQAQVSGRSIAETVDHAREDPSVDLQPTVLFLAGSLFLTRQTGVDVDLTAPDFPRPLSWWMPHRTQNVLVDYDGMPHLIDTGFMGERPVWSWARSRVIRAHTGLRLLEALLVGGDSLSQEARFAGLSETVRIGAIGNVMAKYGKTAEWRHLNGY